MTVEVKPVHDVVCHCGAVRLRLRLTKGIEDPIRCNCSLCARRGTIMASVDTADLEVVSGAGNLGRYQFHTGVAEHYFCKTCGIYTHHRRRSDPAQFGFNVACLEGVNPFALEPVSVYDGLNHEKDSV